MTQKNAESVPRKGASDVTKLIPGPGQKVIFDSPAVSLDGFGEADYSPRLEPAFAVAFCQARMIAFCSLMVSLEYTSLPM